MKRRTIVLLIALAFVLLACGVAYAAELGIFDLTVQDGVSLTPQKADETEIVSETVGDVEFYAGAERLGLTYSTGIESGKEYLVMVLRGEDATPTADNIVYIDQLTARGDEIEFNLYPSLLESGEEYHVYLSTNAEGSDGLTEIASFRYGWVGSADKSALADAISLAEALEGSDYTAESWAALQDALAAAKEVMADENATQDEVNAAAAALQAAIDALEANTYEPFTLSDSEITVPAQSTYTLKVEGAGTVTWSSSNEAVATVDQTGVVSAKLYGTAVISVTDGTTTLECTVNVLFSDVTKTSLYYYKPVYWAAENNITVGYNSGPYIGQFGVGLNCERRQLMLFLWRYAGSPTKDANGKTYPDAKTLFNDVGAYSASSGTNKAIAWAYTEGIAKGYKDGGFHPTAPIVRKDVMIMLYRLAGKPAVSGTLSFPDCQQYKPTSDTYKAILWGSQKGITKGYSSGEYAGQFGANLECLREQIVTFLYRYNNLNITNEFVDADETDEIVDIIEIEN